MVEEEYIRFLLSLVAKEVSCDARKIANLVLQNVETLIPLSTARGQRIKKIVAIAQANWLSLSSDIQPIGAQAEKHAHPFVGIKSLTVGPFRGFAKQETFDLSSKLVLIYGPNGTGKSSFCEALEFCLLGNVSDAEYKRFRNQNDYLENAHTNSYTAPNLIGTDSKGNDVVIIGNEMLYRFCFIEKNRIDNFSRIAAQAPAKQTELISTLFGLDSFSEFVRNFTDSMENYIDLVGVKTEKLNQKKLELAGFRQNLEVGAENLRRLVESESELAKRYRNGCNFQQVVLELHGSEGRIGKIAQLESELQKPIGTKTNVLLSDFIECRRTVEDTIRELEIKQLELEKSSQQLSYRQLYEAINQLEIVSADRCPACHTPITRVEINPYVNSKVELGKLRYLGECQEEINRLRERLNQKLNSISRYVDICCLSDSKDNALLSCKVTDGRTPTLKWWEILNKQTDEGITPLERLETHVKILEDADREIASALDRRTRVGDELKLLRGFSDEITKLESRRESENEIIRSAKSALDKFDTDNASLISDAESEKVIVKQNQEISDAYDEFVNELKDYNINLPAQLVADMGEMTVMLYNAFNRHDPENEQLAMVRLPLKQNQRLEISFRNQPSLFYDALHILSEGHIRCLGLAILATKNMKEKCPVLIFDDPVNAIDDDHRESIRRTMFEDTYFEDKQIILACHGEEFFKDIQNLLTAEKSKKIKAISFLPKNGDVHICVDQSCAPRNYILASRIHYEKGEIRDALDKARKALESLTKDKVWSYVRKYGDGNLSIKMNSPKTPIELRNLTEQLKSRIDKADFRDQKKDSVLEPIKCLLGIGGDSREWRYLNKGTHEEASRDEFDRTTVSSIISSLEKIDSAIANPI